MRYASPLACSSAPTRHRPEPDRCRYAQVFKDHITLADYEVHNGMNLELYYT